MSPLIAIAITTGILSAVWGWVAVTLGLISWGGVLGCTSYFASSGGYKALLQTLLCNASGMLWALLLIHGDAWWGAGVAGYLMTGVVAPLMCVQARQQWLSYIPGTFAGCCAPFGAAGEWRLLRTIEGNVTLAASMAGRNRTDFYKLLNRHGIEAANFKSKG